MSKKNKIENLLFEIYNKGVKMQTCDLTAYYEKINKILTPTKEINPHKNEPR